MRAIVVFLTLGVSGCGRVAFDPLDAVAGDAPDAAPAMTCFDRWRTGVPPLSVPQLIVDDGTNEYDPVLSPDGLRLYYVTDADTDLHTYYTERPSLDDDFVEKGLALEFPTVARANLVFLDDVTVYATDLAAPSNYDITLYERAEPTATFQAVPDPGVAVLNSGQSELDVYVSPDRRTVYFTSLVSESDFDIYRATRPASTDAWGTPTPIPSLAGPGVDELDPYLTPDGLTMFYSAVSPAPQREYITTRASTSDEFAPGTLIDLGAPGSSSHDAVLSPNGCELYFSSDRANGNNSIFRASVL